MLIPKIKSTKTKLKLSCRFVLYYRLVSTKLIHSIVPETVVTVVIVRIIHSPKRANVSTRIKLVRGDSQGGIETAKSDIATREMKSFTIYCLP